MPAAGNEQGRYRKAAYSVTEVAALCDLSRARFYDLVREGVMPYPVYCIRTRKPLYTAGLAEECLRVRRTATAIDGRYVIFYQRRSRPPTPATPAPAPTPRPRQTPAADPLLGEMVEALRAMGARGTDAQLRAAVAQQCPDGVREESFEIDLRAVFDALRRRTSA